jgi:PAS domain S-box-containing protein
MLRSQIIGTSLLVFLSAIVVALLIERTRRARTERAARASEERFRLIADRSPVMMWTTRADATLDYLNRTCLEFSGLPLEQLLDNGWLNAVHPDDVERCIRTYAPAFEARAPFQMEYRLRRADGAYRWVLDWAVPRYESDGRFLGYNGATLDITDRKEMENALRESQKRYALATAAGAVGVWDWNLESNDIYVDPKLKAMLGYDDAEIPNRLQDWGARVYADDVDAVMTQARACIDGATDDYEIAHRMVHKDGRLLWFLARGSLIRHADGTPHRLVGTDTNITERKQVDEAIRENEAMLLATNQQIQDLAGRLIAAQEVERARIARELHDDLSQELAGLAIALSGLKRRLAPVPDAADLHDEVSSLQEHTTALAESIRRLSHDLHPSVLQHAGLVPALSAHCSELQRQRQIEVSFTTHGEFGTTDRDIALCLYRITQEALRNVVTHAQARRAEVTLVDAGDHIQLTVTDDGKGFDVTEARASGRGLGLVSMSERVRLAGGSVSVRTELDRGTTVRLQLPRSGAATAETARLPTAESASLRLPQDSQSSGRQRQRS